MCLTLTLEMSKLAIDEGKKLEEKQRKIMDKYMKLAGVKPKVVKPKMAKPKRQRSVSAKRQVAERNK